MLLYPVLDLRAASDSYRRFAAGPSLTAERMRWYIAQYAPSPGDRLDPRASPLLAPTLQGLPPALVLAAGLDPLVDEGRAYAERLGAAGIAVDYRLVADHPHGFVSWSRHCRAADLAFATIAAALRAAFAAQPGSAAC